MRKLVHAPQRIYTLSCISLSLLIHFQQIFNGQRRRGCGYEANTLVVIQTEFEDIPDSNYN